MYFFILTSLLDWTQNVFYVCEKSRIEKNRNMNNPFKFGTIVGGEYFTDRVAEQKK